LSGREFTGKAKAMTSPAIRLQPVAILRSPRIEATDDFWGSVESVIEIDSRFGADALLGIDQFSHLEIVFLMHRVDPRTIETSARHPRERMDWPRVGIFAQRGKARPNRIGVSRCELVGVDGMNIRVRGLDAIDGTPVLDIKPWLAEFGPRGEVVQPDWSQELMRDYYLER
jgi:tRNA-Thr(GGU) m(6)t(6)A37 methyltransferase TsaA